MSAEQDREPLSTAYSQAVMPAGAVFLSYASEDAAAAERIAAALRSAGIQVWFDKSELRGGDAWDRQIRQQIHDCRLFMAVISPHTEARDEGYFRREWKLAVDRTHDMAERRAFLVPVAIDGTPERGASVPEKFRELQWTRLPAGETPSAFVERIRRLLSPDHDEASRHRHPVPVRADSNPLRSPGRARKVGLVGRRAYILWGLMAIVVLALGYLAVQGFLLSKHLVPSTQVASSTGPSAARAQGTIPEKSIAVLPFEDMSEKHDQAYFADGMAEEIIARLARIRELRVSARASSFYFRGKNEKIAAIANELGVAHILEGSVRKAGEHLRVTAELVRAGDGAQIWAETYDP